MIFFLPILFSKATKSYKVISIINFTVLVEILLEMQCGTIISKSHIFWNKYFHVLKIRIILIGFKLDLS